MLSATILYAILATAPLDSVLASVASLPGEPNLLSAAGLAGDRPVLTLENASSFDPAAATRRVVLVGSDEASAEAVIAAVRWLKQSAPRSIRDRWVASALPLAAFAPTDKQSLLRWLTFQAPDLIVEVGAGGVVQAEGVRVEKVPAGDAIAVLQKLLPADGGSRSALHEEVAARVRRPPLEIARLLAGRYP